MNRAWTVDPPWSFDDALPGDTRGALKQYPTMSIEQIKQEVIVPPLAPDAYLFLWRVSSMVEEAYSLVRHWGFEPKSEIVWNKLTRHGKKWFGMGRSVRAAHETCIIATRGKPKPISKSVRSTFSAVVPSHMAWSKKRKKRVLSYWHSAKPDEFYTLVEALVAGPYVETFARQWRPGWTCMGKPWLDHMEEVQEAA